MTIVVGCTSKESSASALELAGMLARSTGEEVVVAVVVAAAWPPSTERVDADYRAYLTQWGNDALAQASAWMPGDVKASYVLHTSSSIPAGLREVAEKHQAKVLILGSAESGGLGSVALGSVAEALVHSSSIPVALAPRGFRGTPEGRVRRITVAFGSSAKDHGVLMAGADYAARTGSALRIASFSVRPKRLFAGGTSGVGEDLVVEEWAQRMRELINEDLEKVRKLPEVPSPLEVVIGDGYGWRDAMANAPWTIGDLLLVGSGSHGPVPSVFLGTRSSKIVRHSPVPVVILPRSRAAD